MKSEIFIKSLNAENVAILERAINRMGWRFEYVEDNSSILVNHPENDASLIDFLFYEYM